MVFIHSAVGFGVVEDVTVHTWTHVNRSYSIKMSP